MQISRPCSCEVRKLRMQWKRIDGKRRPEAEVAVPLPPRISAAEETFSERYQVEKRKRLFLSFIHPFIQPTSLVFPTLFPHAA